LDKATHLVAQPSNESQIIALQVAAFYSDNGVTPAYYLSQTYSYGAQNNGNVLAIYNNKDASRSQSFTYDSLNRLTHAENSGTDCGILGQ
jgi:hypothetical protein